MSSPAYTDPRVQTTGLGLAGPATGDRGLTGAGRKLGRETVSRSPAHSPGVIHDKNPHSLLPAARSLLASGTRRQPQTFKPLFSRKLPDRAAPGASRTQSDQEPYICFLRSKLPIWCIMYNETRTLCLLEWSFILRMWCWPKVDFSVLVLLNVDQRHCYSFARLGGGSVGIEHGTSVQQPLLSFIKKKASFTHLLACFSSELKAYKNFLYIF